MIRTIALVLGFAMGQLMPWQQNRSSSPISGSKACRRISEGTVFNYLPLDAGDQLTRLKARVLPSANCIAPVSSRTSASSARQYPRHHRAANAQLSQRLTSQATRQSRKRTCCACSFDIGLSEGEVFDRLVARPPAAGTDQAIFQPGPLCSICRCPRDGTGPQPRAYCHRDRRR